MASSDNPGARNGRHTRDDVAEAALRILDDHGLPDLTMRRLAAALDVQPSALYWHFPNKQTLLAELADRIADRARPRPDPDADWAALARAEAFGLRDALLAYRDGAEVVSSSFALGLGASTPLTRLRAALERGFDAATSARAAAALLHFVLGHVSHEQQRLQYDSLGVVTAPDPAVADTGADTAEAFAFGVDLLLEGLSHTTPASADPTPAPVPTSADPSFSTASAPE
ncbi:TetR family transcriptional regulator [Herbiconiux sp.]|uniref:TetR family transcriptional regulator n=1 Tax=Herbiconiux sp. TaxID=1871186 RepID=UPI0025C72269|nr:TetR family transcriptional regulator [Herbiconiux sp.]